MKWSGVMPVSSLTVAIVQPGSRPSWPRLVLNRGTDPLCGVAGMTLSEPSVVLVVHSGMPVTRSRGMESAVAFVRSLDTWKRSVVSAWPTLPESP